MHLNCEKLLWTLAIATSTGLLQMIIEKFDRYEFNVNNLQIVALHNITRNRIVK